MPIVWPVAPVLPLAMAMKLDCCSMAAIFTVTRWSGSTQRTRNSASIGWTSIGTLLHSSSSSHTRWSPRAWVTSRRARDTSPNTRPTRSVPRRVSRTASRRLPAWVDSR